MTINTAVEKSKVEPEPTSGKPELSLRKRYERVIPHVRRALHGVQNPRERKMQRNAAFIASDSLMQELDPVIQAAKIDPLTGLNTIQTFKERLKFEANKAKDTNGSLRLLFIDLDGFKPVNDKMGHDIGDQVLKQIAEEINRSIRPTDVAGRTEEKEETDELPVNGETGRYGGDEFVVLLPDTDDEGANAVIKRLKRRISNLPIQETLASSGLHVTMSVGTSPINLDNPLDSLKEADKAMYAAKKGKPR